MYESDEIEAIATERVVNFAKEVGIQGVVLQRGIPLHCECYKVRETRETEVDKSLSGQDLREKLQQFRRWEI